VKLRNANKLAPAEYSKYKRGIMKLSAVLNISENDIDIIKVTIATTARVTPFTDCEIIEKIINLCAYKSTSIEESLKEIINSR